MVNYILKPVNHVLKHKLEVMKHVYIERHTGVVVLTIIGVHAWLPQLYFCNYNLPRGKISIRNDVCVSQVTIILPLKYLIS